MTLYIIYTRRVLSLFLMYSRNTRPMTLYTRSPNEHIICIPIWLVYDGCIYYNFAQFTLHSFTMYVRVILTFGWPFHWVVCIWCHFIACTLQFSGFVKLWCYLILYQCSFDLANVYVVQSQPVVPPCGPLLQVTA